MSQFIRRSILIFLDFILILAIFLFSDICLAQDNCQHTDTSFYCVKYLYNMDGDTFKVDIPNIHSFFGKNMSIRIAGIDTPEIHSKNECERKVALKARERVQGILSNAKRIDIVSVSPDKYWRIDATTIVDNTINLGYLLMKENLAYPYDGKTKYKKDWCSVAASLKKR